MTSSKPSSSPAKTSPLGSPAASACAFWSLLWTSAKTIVSALRSGDLSQLDGLTIQDEDAAFLSAQTRIALRRCGIIDPNSIDEYLADGGYEALKKVLTTMTPEQVIEEIQISGLAGRGGAGFPTWFKWNAARQSEGTEKYLICNADEGDPGAFMDRAVIESDPHDLIEGMLIAAYAIGAQECVVYVRAEYPLAIVRLSHAVEQATARGLLGQHIMGTTSAARSASKRGQAPSSAARRPP